MNELLVTLTEWPRTRRRARFACPTLAQSSTRQRAATPRRYAQIELNLRPRAAQVLPSSAAAVVLGRSRALPARMPSRIGPFFPRFFKPSTNACRYCTRRARPGQMRSANTYLCDRVGRCLRAPIRRNGNRRAGLVDPTPSAVKARHLQRRGRRHRFRARDALRQGGDRAVDPEQTAVEAAPAPGRQSWQQRRQRCWRK